MLNSLYSKRTSNICRQHFDILKPTSVIQSVIPFYSHTLYQDHLGDYTIIINILIVSMLNKTPNKTAYFVRGTHVSCNNHVLSDANTCIHTMAVI